MRLKTFHCGYYCTDYSQLKHIGSAYRQEWQNQKKWMKSLALKGNGWYITFIKARDRLLHRGKKEAIIHASSPAQAQAVSNLIFAAQYLKSGTDIFGGEPHNVIPCRKKPNENTNQGELLYGELHDDSVPLYCEIAAKASLDIHTEVALSKYQLSCEFFSSHYMDVTTYDGDLPLLSPYTHDHVRLAYAIVVAYAVIEELGLEVRVKDVERVVEENGVKFVVKEKESSKLPNGDWNLRVRQDLETRLVANGVNLEEKFHWTARGGKTPLESKRPPKIRKLWRPQNDHIRDGEIDIADAIAYVSWLRSSISAHRLSEKAKSLTFLEVFNAQVLARRLLLETLGFWR